MNLKFSCASIALLESGNLETILSATQPRVVIVGGGFGGLFATRELAGAPVSVTLIDKRNYHLFRPMLYQVATGLLSADQIAGPLRSILNRQKNVEVLLDEVSGIDTEKRLVHLKQHVVPYDFLVLATGIQYNYFGHEDWRRTAPGLASLDDADLIRGKVLLAFERAEEIAALDHADDGENTPTAHVCAGRRGDGGRGNGKHSGGNVAHGPGARFSPHRSSLGADPPVRGGPAGASHFSGGAFGQGAAPSGEPGREGVHEHTRHGCGRRRDRCQWRARSGQHGAVERGRACVSRRPMAGSGHGQVGKDHR